MSPGPRRRARLSAACCERRPDDLRPCVTTISKHDGVFSVTTEQHGTLEGLAVLIATGASPVRLDAPGAAELLNQGLGYSATTHAHMVGGQAQAVVGATGARPARRGRAGPQRFACLCGRAGRVLIFCYLF